MSLSFRLRELLLLLCLISGLYAIAGSAVLVIETTQIRAFDREMGLTMRASTPQQALAGLLGRYAQTTPDWQGYVWFHLARVWEMLGDGTRAQGAYAKAYTCYPEHPEIIAHYAQTYVEAGQALPEPLQQAVVQTLETVPDRPELWNLLAMSAFLQAHYRQAIAYWEKMLPLIEQDSALQGTVQHAMRVARQKIQ